MQTPRRALSLALTLGLACLAPPARGDNPTVDGLFISVPGRIDSDFVSQVKNSIDRKMAGAAAAELKIVLDFNPTNQASTSDQFGACYDLADYLLTLQTIKTIAFVHAPVSRHTVLPVLACKEVVMSHEGRLGPGLGDNEPLGDVVRAGYKKVVEGRSLSPALVMKLVQRDLDVFEGTRNGAKVFLSREEVEQLRGKPGFQLNKPDPILPQGLASYTAGQAKDFGLCSQILATAQEVATAYHMPLGSLRGDPLAGRAPVAALVKVNRPLNQDHYESLDRRIRKVIGQKKVNMIILWLECGGTDEDNTDLAVGMAKWFRTLRDEKDNNLRVMTVAYIPGEARDTATILAMGCDEIVMHRNAKL